MSLDSASIIIGDTTRMVAVARDAGGSNTIGTGKFTFTLVGQ